MEYLALGFDVSLRGQAAMLGQGMPGADGLAPIALRNKDINVNGMPLLQFGDHANQPVNAPLRQPGFPFPGIDDVVHVFALHLDAGDEQLAARIPGEAVLG